MTRIAWILKSRFRMVFLSEPFIRVVSFCRARQGAHTFLSSPTKTLAYQQGVTLLNQLCPCRVQACKFVDTVLIFLQDRSIGFLFLIQLEQGKGATRMVRKSREMQ